MSVVSSSSSDSTPPHPPSSATSSANSSPPKSQSASAASASASSAPTVLAVRSGVFGLPTLATLPPQQQQQQQQAPPAIFTASPLASASHALHTQHAEQDDGTHLPDPAAAAASPSANSHSADEEEHAAIVRQHMTACFIAGGAAGAASRTVVSPLERLKILQQIQPSGRSRQAGAPGSIPRALPGGGYTGVWQGLVKMWKEEGFRGYMRGNWTNCIRIAPYSAVQFTTYDWLKEYLRDPATGTLNDHRKLTAGALAGIASVVSTYPLDLVRSRISIASASLFADQASSAAAKRVPGIWAMTVKVYMEEGGLRGLYRGCIATSAGVAPYVSLNFYVYEALRAQLVDENGQISTVAKLACGGVAGSISQTLTYPLDVLRRRMQIVGMKEGGLGGTEKNSYAIMRNLFIQEGVRGLYRGLLSNLLKVAPSIATSFTVYETVQQLLEPKHALPHA
ncbi:hypothetical protein OC845_003220 [Tilletia horrida]|nr:hypothetical protein OC845_003220 [Tilletia horrida]